MQATGAMYLNLLNMMLQLLSNLGAEVGQWGEVQKRYIANVKKAMKPAHQAVLEELDNSHICNFAKQMHWELVIQYTPQ